MAGAKKSSGKKGGKSKCNYWPKCKYHHDCHYLGLYDKHANVVWPCDSGVKINHKEVDGFNFHVKHPKIKIGNCKKHKGGGPK
eukprot:NODE_4353_length_476_cov_1481.430913_g3741_i0.p3 GENE.NODE_4353_length_476_cov_1481.430913_g3741_i0~~NODE_4353_length_476_cov_1481.430913_g3741_i0.p3  ORF type:complete len:83 (-),score=22.57 NODE_4353_length_476_cov_1481.430913_g3741_i0:134-382(-)